LTQTKTIPLDLNPPQQEAVEHTEGPLLVLAGAGSGKTRVLACRASHIVHSGLARPYQILALTFTNKAAGELRERIVSMVGPEGEGVVAGTFHSIFARIMRREGLNIGIDPHFTIVDADDRRRLIKVLLKERNIPTTSVRPVEVDWKIGRAKNALETPDDLAGRARDYFDQTAAEIYLAYEKRLRRIKGLDFDDLLIRPIRAFQEHPDFLERLQNRFHYVLVDEFQDTNHAQYILVRDVARKHRNLCVVGDDDQAIYGWRGAKVGNILDFERDWSDTKVIRLEQNYRSNKPILDVAWSVIKHNRKRRAKKLWTARKGGSSVELIETSSDEDEALRVVGFIEEEHIRNRRPYNEMAILYRTNAQSLAFERAFRAAKIAYKVVGGLRFYERREIKDVLAYLRLLVNPADDISLLRIINYPPRGIGQALMTDIQARARAESINLNLAISALIADPELSTRRRNNLENFLNLMGEFREFIEQLSFPDLVREILVKTGLKERLEAEDKDDPIRAESRIANLDSLLRDIERYIDVNPEGTIESFLEEVSLITDADQVNEKARGVNLLTLHSAKGLEFKVVFITGLEDGLLPLSPRDSHAVVEHFDEERRLFYVGATRAMDRLVLTFATNRFRWGAGNTGEPSRFLDEIPHNLLSIHGGFGRERKPTPRLQRRAASATRRIPDYSKPTSQAPSTKTGIAPDELRKGLLVKHPKFGLGIIVDFHSHGFDSKVNVDFDDAGSKMLILKYAKLEVAK